MISRPRRVVLLSLLCLTTLAASASAECAWVLWGLTDESRAGVPQAVWWDPESAYPNSDGCKQALQERIRSFARIDRPGRSQEAVGDALLSRIGSGPDAVTRTTIYRCLPDTLDPRGPKGK